MDASGEFRFAATDRLPSVLVTLRARSRKRVRRCETFAGRPPARSVARNRSDRRARTPATGLEPLRRAPIIRSAGRNISLEPATTRWLLGNRSERRPPVCCWPPADLESAHPSRRPSPAGVEARRSVGRCARAGISLLQPRRTHSALGSVIRSHPCISAGEGRGDQSCSQLSPRWSSRGVRCRPTRAPNLGLSRRSTHARPVERSG